MLTRIDVDDKLIAQAMRSTGLSSRGAVVNLALQTLLGMAVPERHHEARWLTATDPCADEPAEFRLDEHEADLTFFAAYLGLPSSS